MYRKSNLAVLLALALGAAGGWAAANGANPPVAAA
jgi:hypothetical protein